MLLQLTSRKFQGKLGKGSGAWLIVLGLLAVVVSVEAHDTTVLTHSFDRGSPGTGPRLELLICDAATGLPIPARFTVRVNGNPVTAAWIDGNGIRFASHHLSKRQNFTSFYSRGTGSVVLELPEEVERVSVTALQGFEYLPATVEGVVREGRVSVKVPLRRWGNWSSRGWISADEHLHYDRLDAADDETWLEMLAAEGLTAGHFLVLKGGLVPGIWARQHAYGSAGQAGNGVHLLVPGQEYRDTEQGHVILLGGDRVIEPMSTGGMGYPPVPEHFPPLHDVLGLARSQGALVGAAHAGVFGRHATAMADAILGALDFWELSNGFVYSTATWYRLMNCGIFLPPAAGTDLPILPFRDDWQPMLGAVRTYVNTGGRSDFASFKSGLARGEVFITGDALVEFKVSGQPAGGVVRLPAGGGFVTVSAELSSPRIPREFTLVRDGKKESIAVRKTVEEGIFQWRFDARIHFARSGWLAVEARGATSVAQGTESMTHTNAVQVLVGDEPVWFPEDAIHLRREVEDIREFYAEAGVYAHPGDRAQVLDLFDRALAKLTSRAATAK